MIDSSFNKIIEDLNIQITNLKNEKAFLINNLNSLSQQLQIYQNVGLNIHNTIFPLIQHFKPLSLFQIIEQSKLSQNYKKQMWNLIEKYEKYCLNKANKSSNCNSSCPLDNFKGIYDWSNAFNFVMEKSDEKYKYERTTQKKYLNFFLNLIRESTGNPFLKYTQHVGQFDKSKEKHYVTKNEFTSFIQFLTKAKKKQILWISEWLYEYGIRISAIAKLHVFDIDNNKTITFHEKNKIDCIRTWYNGTFDRIKNLIKLKHLKQNNYVFYHNKFPHQNDIDKRCKYFSNIMRKILIKSNCFTNNKNQVISSHMFRMSKAVDTFLQIRLEQARKELNHSNLNTTKTYYIKNAENEFNNSNFVRRTEEEMNSVWFGKQKSFDFTTINKEDSLSVDDNSSNNEVNNNEELDEIRNNTNKRIEGRVNYKQIDSITWRINKKYFKQLKQNNQFWNNNNYITLNFISFDEVNFNLFKENILNSFNQNNVSYLNKIIESKLGINNYSYHYKDEFVYEVTKKDFTNLEEAIELQSSFIFNGLSFKIKHNKMNIYTAKTLKQNTFICLIAGTIKYRVDMINDINNTITKNTFLPLFSSSKKKYDRILDFNKEGNLFKLIDITDDEKKGNLKIMKICTETNQLFPILVTSVEIEKNTLLTLYLKQNE